MTKTTWRLGLIGGNIRQSRSPALHIACALSLGGNASYDLLIPDEWDHDFIRMLSHCRDCGFDGVNVTYPFKELAAAMVPAGDPVVTAMGSSNTIHFSPEGPRAYNTDYSGFVSAFRSLWPGRRPGRVLMIGAGGVGRAIGFGLAELGAEMVALIDSDPAKSASLAEALSAQGKTNAFSIDGSALADLGGYDGVVNCTPLGMAGKPGSPLPEGVKGEPSWAFDAVYTPDHTTFRAQLEGLGADFLSGYELYFHQGIQAFEIFTGQPVRRTDWLRDVLNQKG
ncbi:shikimate dehydrogenase family protein [Pannonibacter carbonis]|uniref:shikimate dehydrogenase family protein n=1 Tax=Pannonibacter carbonis TaxID=2067569 RepID=UPI000D1142BF|nr:shikimate dehydrogenase [Pannonibacter carbonis]